MKKSAPVLRRCFSWPQWQRRRRRVALGLLLAAEWLLSAQPKGLALPTATLTTLYSFSNNDAYNGLQPSAALLLGSDGNFYGTTAAGGGLNGGTIFEIDPAGTLTIIYSFRLSTYGADPVAGLIQGDDGAFYGTTFSGGAKGDGLIFQFTPGGAFNILYSFSGGSDGSQPDAGLTQGSDGNYYGTTAGGGDSAGKGTIFQITPTGTFTTLYQFGGSDGSQPQAGLVLGSDGNFYGVTSSGGDLNGDGTVFVITPGDALTTLYSFTGGNDGSQPQAGLVQGSDGNFYGTTFAGGASDEGTVFRVTAAGAFTTLHSFSGADGANPESGLVQGSDGNLYGTTSSGGDASGDGTVFEITPAGVLTTLHDFQGSDGSQPHAGLIQGGDGSFYGVTYSGGSGGNGTVFKLILTDTSAAFFVEEVSLGSGVYYLQLSDGNPFGYYSFLANPAYIYHFDLGYEYVLDADDGNSGVYLYDFASNTFFYTSPVFPFPYLYDFSLNSVLYYYPDTTNSGHYTSNPRYFFNFATGQIITK